MRLILTSTKDRPIGVNTNCIVAVEDADPGLEYSTTVHLMGGGQRGVKEDLDTVLEKWAEVMRQGWIGLSDTAHQRRMNERI